MLRERTALTARYVETILFLELVTETYEQVHEGFQTAYNSISADVISAVESLKQSQPSYSIVLTGHSLGGGVAAIASSSLVGRGHEVKTYTFGEPRNGNQAFVNYLNSQVPPSDYFRVTHANDGVPQIPPRALGYLHHGTEYWQSNGGNNDASSTFDCGDGEATVSLQS